HQNCKKALEKHVAPQAVLAQNEGDPITVDEDFDPNIIKLVGNVTGRPPFKGVVQHRGERLGGVAGVEMQMRLALLREREGGAPFLGEDAVAGAVVAVDRAHVPPAHVRHAVGEVDERLARPREERPGGRQVRPVARDHAHAHHLGLDPGEAATQRQAHEAARGAVGDVDAVRDRHEALVDLVAELEGGLDEAERPDGRGAAGRNEVRRPPLGAHPPQLEDRANRAGDHVRRVDHLRAVVMEQQKVPLHVVRDGLAHQDDPRRQPHAPGVQERGEPVVRAEIAAGQQRARALGQRVAEDPLQLARLVAAVDGRGAVVALHPQVVPEARQAQRLQRRRQVREPHPRDLGEVRERLHQRATRGLESGGREGRG
ncbi:MAG: DUF2760 domain-containing protein, partial [Candidatus Methylomirabilis sp.]|nr:DUF2760 domain-containing protein [Deltaproteobacteria bacterium]